MAKKTKQDQKFGDGTKATGGLVPPEKSSSLGGKARRDQRFGTGRKVGHTEPDNENDRLFKRIEKSYRDWDAFRKGAYRLVSDYAGDGYGPSASAEGAKRETILNLLHQTVSSYMMALAANAPKVMVDTRQKHLRGFARHFELALNNLVKDIGLVHTIRRWVLDSYFMVGIVKVHLADSGLVEIEQDVWADPGFPFASNVSWDNAVADTLAKKWSEVEFVGDAYRIPFEYLKDDTVWIQDAVKDIHPSSKHETDSERLENIGRGQEIDVDEQVPMVDLLDLWLPREGKVVTYACDFRAGQLKPYGKRVAEMEWTGGELGPYHILGFDEVPENLMPIGPASHLAPLARHINNVYRKQVRRARNMKDNMTYTAAGEKSARNLMSANDMEAVQVNDVNEVGVHHVGGVDPQNQMFMLGMMEHFNTLAGNLSALAGLSPSADTLGQERLIQGAVSGRVAQMANRVNEAVVDLMKDLGRLLWDDSVNRIPGQQKLPGLDWAVAQSDWVPGDREGTFDDYDISIDIFSMPYKSAADQANTILNLVGSVYTPLESQMMAQGGMIDMRELNDLLSDLLNQPRLRDVIKFTAPMPQEAPMGGGGGGPTTREYVRKSKGSQQGQNVQSQQAWAAMARGSQQG